MYVSYSKEHLVNRTLERQRSASRFKSWILFYFSDFKLSDGKSKFENWVRDDKHLNSNMKISHWKQKKAGKKKLSKRKLNWFKKSFLWNWYSFRLYWSVLSEFLKDQPEDLQTIHFKIKWESGFLSGIECPKTLSFVLYKISSLKPSLAK